MPRLTYTTIARIKTPDNAIACEMVLVTAPIVRKTADMTNIEMKLKMKKMKNCEGSRLKPAMK